MVQENITINLPATGQMAVIKSYIPHKVARGISSIFLGKQKIDIKKVAEQKSKTEAQNKAMQDEVLAEIELTGEDMAVLDEKLVKGLLVSVGEHYAVDGALDAIVDDLPEEDYKVISQEAHKVYSDYQENTSPKE